MSTGAEVGGRSPAAAGARTPRGSRLFILKSLNDSGTVGVTER
jgi:hypothetical protein